MSYQDRQDEIGRLEALRGSKVISYVLADRETFPAGQPGFAAQMASEPHRIFDRLLTEIGPTDHLDLFLYTRGGATESVWPLVNLLRTYCKSLSVLVPYRAHSAGTLLCLGADEVVMTHLSELSPIDPATGNQFNPRDPINQQQQYPISVEDVSAYFTLAREMPKIESPELMVQVLTQLTNSVHPLALGNVQRVVMMIATVAKKLLEMHLEIDTSHSEEIIRTLTTEFYSHVHAISYSEARALLGEWVVKASDDHEAAILGLFNAYTETLELDTRFNVPEVMGDQPTLEIEPTSGLIETARSSYAFKTRMKISQRSNLPPGTQIQMPPGSAPPLLPWFGRVYEPIVQAVNWKLNVEGV